MGRRQACGEKFGSGSSRAVSEGCHKDRENPSLGQLTKRQVDFFLKEKFIRKDLQTEAASQEELYSVP